MKILIVLFLCLNFSVIAQQLTIWGKVVERETNSGLQDANIVVISETTKGTTTDKNGEFKLIADVLPSDKLIISYVGYEAKSITVAELNNIPSTPTSDGSVFYPFYLDSKIIPSQTVLVEATIGKQGVTPIAFDQIKQKDIEKNYTVYDIPKYLSDLPSTTFY